MPSASKLLKNSLLALFTSLLDGLLRFQMDQEGAFRMQ